MIKVVMMFIKHSRREKVMDTDKRFFLQAAEVPGRFRIEIAGSGWRIDPNDEQLPAASADIDFADYVPETSEELIKDVFDGGEAFRRSCETSKPKLSIDHFYRLLGMLDRMPASWAAFEQIWCLATVVRDPQNRRCILGVEKTGAESDVWNHCVGFRDDEGKLVYVSGVSAHISGV